jgi:uncharacterized protein with GYD domain
MPTYISLIRLTQQGIQSIKKSPDRIDAAKKAYQAAGARMKEFYCVMGQYDIVVIGEAPNDETMAKIAFGLGSLGNIRTETLRAFSEDEYRKIVAGLP